MTPTGTEALVTVVTEQIEAGEQTLAPFVRPISLARAPRSSHGPAAYPPQTPKAARHRACEPVLRPADSGTGVTRPLAIN